jgi:O-antigen/teichoic acid export membrane protein
LTKKEIRLQYSGFAIFIAKMLSVGTGMAFTLMLTRTATEQQYGIWSNINDMIAYFAFLAPAFPFWATRFVARNKEGTIKTGFLANLTVSMVATIIYLPVIPLIMPLLGISQTYIIPYLIASMQIIETYLITMLESCLRAKIPQTIGYGLLIEEICKILLAYILIVKLQQPIIGALISLITAFSVQIIYYLKLLSQELKQPVNWNYVKEWLKGSTINIYYYVGTKVATFTLIMLIAYNPIAGPTARGMYQAAITITNIITYSYFLSFALYPKLLAENSIQDITTSLKTVLMFAIPMTAGAMALSNSYLIMLKEIYGEASPVLIVLAVGAFVQLISTFFLYALLGLENIDKETKIPLRKLVKSPLFMAFTLPYAHSAITLPTTFYVLTTFAQNQPVAAALYVGIIDTIARSIMFLALYVIIRRMVKLNIPWKNIAKYVFASIVMAFILFLIPHPTRLLFTLGITVAGAILYLTLLIAIDKEARALANYMWQEIKFKVKGEV